jgi:hypothetical protein
MNGMILYPTDDEILVLKEAMLESKDEGVKLFTEIWDIAYLRSKLPPLLINETVLG